jgi:hypothetical protein
MQMIKKIITNALLSVFMDKKARGVLNFYKENKSAKQSLDLVSNTSKVSKEPLLAPNKNQDYDNQNSNIYSNDETHQLIINSLNAAKLEISAKPKITEKRKALINNALELQNSKKYILDKLSEKQRRKLKALALFMLNGEASSLVKSKEKTKNKSKKKL